ncbi:hypothetical protein BTS2_3195 [Bacillus sp. TS-2]|nr:hypothetical protein BTS2_3195 [Bacillus sp. TS-2]
MDKKLGKVAHIGIAVRSLEKAIPLYTQQFELKLIKKEMIESQKITVALLQAENIVIELIQPTHEDCSVNRFINRFGEGLHHMAFSVENLDEKMEDVYQSSELKLVDGKSHIGAHQSKISFIHPHSTMGVLIEFIQMKE